MKLLNLIYVSFYLILIGCSEKSELTTKVQAAFTPITYYNAQDTGKKIKFISERECEISNSEKILLGEYQKSDTEFRVIVGDKGTAQVIYYLIIGTGHLSASGETYLNELELKKYQEKIAQDQAEAQRLAQEKVKRDYESAAKLGEDAKKLLIGRWRREFTTYGLRENGMGYLEFLPDWKLRYVGQDGSVSVHNQSWSVAHDVLSVNTGETLGNSQLIIIKYQIVSVDSKNFFFNKLSSTGDREPDIGQVTVRGTKF